MIQPIRDQILVKPLPPDGISEGGIIVPESYQAESNKCEVIEVGNGLKDKPMRFRKGDIIFRVKNWGVPVQERGLLYYIMSQDSVLAKL